MARHHGTVALVAAFLLALVAVVPAHGSTVAPSRSGGLPLYQFTQKSATTPVWNATSLAKADGGAAMLGAPRAAQSGDENVVVFTTVKHTIGVVTEVGSSTTYTDLSSVVPTPAATDPPQPFFDGAGLLNVAYVDTSGTAILLTDDPSATTSALGRGSQFLQQPWIVTNLTATASLVGAATGQLAVVTEGSDDLIAVRTSTEQLDVLTVLDQRPFAVTTTTAVDPTVGIATSPTFLGTPVDGVATLAATTVTGALDVFTQQRGGTWSADDLTTTIKSPTIAGAVVGAASATDLYVAGSSRGSGDAELDTMPLSTGVWTNTNLTTRTAKLATPGPALSGQLALATTASGVTLAGAAAGWGDLFAYDDVSGAWAVTDVTASGGGATETVGGGVAALDPSDSVTFYAGGVSQPALPGVGIYDIPSADLPHAVADGWPILADTGGLGTTGAPYVNVPSGTTTQAEQTAIEQSEDFQVGLAVAAAHKREGWLSFWTVSGPNQLETAKPGTYRSNAYAAGAAVATTIDQYAANGLSRKPDWVILDPEGFPDNHSQLDGFDVAKVHGNGKQVTVTTESPTALATGDVVSLAETGVSALDVPSITITVTSPTTFHFPSAARATAGGGRVLEPALIVANWNATMAGWAAGITSVDPSLHAAIYVDESEYQEGHLSATATPVFIAIAWGLGQNAPEPITHSSNVMGFIEFGNVCKRGDVQNQLTMFDTPPWNGRYDTVQFTPPGYCTPSTP